MRKLIVSEFLSLDGVMQAPGGAEEDTEGGFRHGGWTMPYWHDDIGRAFVGLMVLGPGHEAVVGGLVVVPDHDPRRAGVSGLQLRIGFVLRVAAAIVVEGDDLAVRVMRPLSGDRIKLDYATQKP